MVWAEINDKFSGPPSLLPQVVWEDERAKKFLVSPEYNAIGLRFPGATKIAYLLMKCSFDLSKALDRLEETSAV